jgi:phytoene synthase
MKVIFDKLSARCSRETTRIYSTSFSLGILFLEQKIQNHIYAIYGFVRLADEIVDSFHDYPKSQMLAELSIDCFTAIERGISTNPIINSFQQVVNEFHIDHTLIIQFLQSMEMDLADQTYTTENYQQYILGSAQAVGLMCLQVFTNGDKEEYEHLKPHAMKLGSAFQKVNFLRDISADYSQLKRTYFPDINISNFTEQDKKAIEMDIRRDLTDALEGIRQLPKSSRRGVYLAYLYYSKLLLKISKVPAREIMSQRIRVSNLHIFRLMFYAFTR